MGDPRGEWGSTQNVFDGPFCLPSQFQVMSRAWLVVALACAGSASGLRVGFSARRPRTVAARSLAPPVMTTNETDVGTSPAVGTSGDFGNSALQRCALARAASARGVVSQLTIDPLFQQ